MTFYNDNDPEIAHWLRELIGAELLPAGAVDGRSICSVRSGDVSGDRTCHFFAGIGGWAHALKLAAWPEQEPVWTASCPCQPFSVAGKRKGTKDKRHLWPVLYRLIGKCRPPVIFGEQVASKAGRVWLARVRSQMEALGYAFGAADLCAAGISAPHIRQRLFWVAHAAEKQSARAHIPERSGRQKLASPDASWNGKTGRLAESQSPEVFARFAEVQEGPWASVAYGSGNCRHYGGMEYTTRDGWIERWPQSSRRSVKQRRISVRLGNTSSKRSQRRNLMRHGGDQWIVGQASLAWDTFEVIPCADQKTRRIEPGTFPLAHGVSGRVGLLRGYGNAIVPELAAEFIRAVMEALAFSL